MRQVKLLAPFLIFFLLTATAQAEFSCTCHSKRAATKTMHEALVGRDCFSCHARGEKLRKKGGIPPEKHEEFMKRRLVDALCLECHANDKIKQSAAKESKPEISPFFGQTYCPKCRKTGPQNIIECARCGEPVIDLEKTMRESALNPDPAICKKCHYIDEDLATKHAEVEEGLNHDSDCLECHKGHNECGGCH